jgi:hypothetical protein
MQAAQLTTSNITVGCDSASFTPNISLRALEQFTPNAIFDIICSPITLSSSFPILPFKILFFILLEGRGENAAPRSCACAIGHMENGLGPFPLLSSPPPVGTLYPNSVVPSLMFLLPALVPALVCLLATCSATQVTSSESLTPVARPRGVQTYLSRNHHRVGAKASVPFPPSRHLSPLVTLCGRWTSLCSVFMMVLMTCQHVQRVESQSYSRLARLIAADGAARDYFGFSVSVYTSSALIGAECDDDKAGEAGEYSEVWRCDDCTTV